VPFHFSERFFAVAGPNPTVPHIARDTVGTYADMASAPGFYIGRTESGRLAYLETWERMREDGPLDLIVGGKTLRDYDIPIQGMDPATQVLLFFMEIDGVWHEVPVEATEGEMSIGTQNCPLIGVQDWPSLWRRDQGLIRRS
jgi:hypothetical protein